MDIEPYTFYTLKEQGMIYENYVRTVEVSDFSRPYEKDVLSIIALDNGRYITILEKGCSCYDPRTDAYVEHFPDLASAEAKMARYKSEHSYHKWWS